MGWRGDSIPPTRGFSLLRLASVGVAGGVGGFCGAECTGQDEFVGGGLRVGAAAFAPLLSAGVVSVSSVR